jgi:hypothetical protein
MPPSGGFFFWGDFAMGKADFVVNDKTRLTSGTFNIQTRVTAKPKRNTFWRQYPAAPVVDLRAN